MVSFAVSLWFSGHRHIGGLPGGNPVYELGEGIISIMPQNLTANIQDSSQSSNRDRSESQPDW